jgi:predicted nuclease of predicted toxin-antitoxin system
VIVTKDSDFYDRLTVKGYPPKLIWVRTGNLSTPFLTKLFQSKQAAIKTFLQDPDLGYLEIL